jgi:plasmid stability protein
MANLLVRGIDDALVAALKARAARHKRSAEAEHRAILAAALAAPRRRSFAEALACIPNVGRDEDFERLAEEAEASRVVD